VQLTRGLLGLCFALRHSPSCGQADHKDALLPAAQGTRTFEHTFQTVDGTDADTSADPGAWPDKVAETRVEGSPPSSAPRFAAVQLCSGCVHHAMHACVSALLHLCNRWKTNYTT